jgi:hypothetical protein
MNSDNIQFDFENISKRIVTHINGRTIIDGGHYLLEEDESGKIKHLVNPVSTATLRAAVHLYKCAKNEKKNVSLGFMMGDLAISPDKRQECNSSFEFPEEYTKILRENGISPEEIIIFYESSLRNRGDKTLKKGLKEGKVVRLSNRLRVNAELFGIADELSNTNPKKPMPNCRMILAQALRDKELKGYNTAVNFCNSEVFKCHGRYSVIYHTLLDGSMNVINAYFTPKSGEVVIDIEKFSK